MTEPVTSTHLYAGAGGDSEGFRQAGIRIKAAANHNPIAIATHQLNHPNTLHNSDNLLDVDWRTFPRTTLLWGSPSCRWHAPAGGRKKLPIEEELKRVDPGAVDRATALAIVCASEVHRYPIVFMENVPEFTGWPLFPWLIDGMHRLDYTDHQLMLNAADFGLGQERWRWFGAFTQPGITIDLTLPDMPAVYADSIIDHDRPLNPVTRRLYVADQIDAIDELGVPHLVTYRRNARPRRADQHRLATVTAGGNHHAIARVDHDGRQWHRMLTHRERARAQGFPDTYRFTGKGDDVTRQIGNAVPVNIARWLGERAREAVAA